jgi:hypothetical protein
MRTDDNLGSLVLEQPAQPRRLRWRATTRLWSISRWRRKLPWRRHRQR